MAESFQNELRAEEATQPVRAETLFRELCALISERNRLTFEITRIRTILGMTGPERPEWRCRRCGHIWVGHSVEHPPKHCSNCHSSGWNEDPVWKTARRPGEPGLNYAGVSHQRKHPGEVGEMPRAAQASQATTGFPPPPSFAPTAYDLPPSPYSPSWGPPREEPSPECVASSSSSAPNMPNILEPPEPPAPPPQEEPQGVPSPAVPQEGDLPDEDSSPE